MKYYNFFVLIKRKTKIKKIKNRIIKDKVKMERERDRDRDEDGEMDDICYKCKPN